MLHYIMIVIKIKITMKYSRNIGMYLVFKIIIMIFSLKKKEISKHNDFI